MALVQRLRLRGEFRGCLVVQTTVQSFVVRTSNLPLRERLRVRSNNPCWPSATAPNEHPAKSEQAELVTRFVITRT